MGEVYHENELHARDPNNNRQRPAFLVPTQPPRVPNPIPIAVVFLLISTITWSHYREFRALFNNTHELINKGRKKE